MGQIKNIKLHIVTDIKKWLNKKKTTIRQTRRTTVRHLCPVCSNVAGRGTFLCLGCSPSRWIHNECGDYSSTEVKCVSDRGEEDSLRCRNCKEVTKTQKQEQKQEAEASDGERNLYVISVMNIIVIV